MRRLSGYATCRISSPEAGGVPTGVPPEIAVSGSPVQTYGSTEVRGVARGHVSMQKGRSGCSGLFADWSSDRVLCRVTAFVLSLTTHGELADLGVEVICLIGQGKGRRRCFFNHGRVLLGYLIERVDGGVDLAQTQ